MQRIFNPPPGWPKPPKGWTPSPGWTPDPSWPPAPPGWQMWLSAEPAESPSTPAIAVATESAVEATTLQSRLSALEAENAALRARLNAPGAGTVPLNDEQVLQDVGVYKYHHPLENAVAYRTKLEEIDKRIADLVVAGMAIEASATFSFEGSLAKGRAMAADLGRLMLRAYNAEAENVIRTLRHGNVTTAIKRLDGTREAIAKLGRMMDMRIADRYHALRVEEVRLVGDYLAKKEEEREAARAERERLREERKVELELAAAREKLEKERSHLLTVLERVRSSGGEDPTLEEKLAAVDAAIAQNDFRAANIRAGYVYVISNRGAFGENVVKIGLTRRLEPLERIAELGDASVPFQFDVHAIFFADDAVTLENELHRHFADRRLNWANNRKEFFFATPAQVRDVLRERVGNLLEFAEEVEATEYNQSLRHWPQTGLRWREEKE